MSLGNGHYRTAAGSTVEISGKHGGVSVVDFDWFEEPNACCDCRVNGHPEDQGNGEWRLTWYCGECGGGSATLEPYTPQVK